MDNKRIEQAISIINRAIEKGISIRKASTEANFSNTYVKNTKAKVYEAYENDKLDSEIFINFRTAYDRYLESRLIVVKDTTPTKSKETVIVKDLGDIKEIEFISTNTIRTLDGLLKEAKVDTSIWNVKEHSINKWDVTAFKSGLPMTVQNWQVKARLEKNKEKIEYFNFIDSFNEFVKSYKVPVVTYPMIPNTSNNLLEISIFDLHLGKLAWGGETGENYDTKIASERFFYSVHTILERADNFKYDRILFPIGNDFFNSDTILNTTTHGTPQDEDLRWQKTFNVGVKLLVDGINVMKSKGVPVDVMIIPGNHDFERSYYMGSFLEAWFRDDSQVNINNGASPRKYYNYGKVLLGFTHGSEEREDSLPLLMATEDASKPFWSNTLFHEWHIGHQHRKKTTKFTILDKNKVLNEDLGVTIRTLSSLTGTEEWHHKKGFVGQIKAADGFLWNAETGMIGHIPSNFIVK